MAAVVNVNINSPNGTIVQLKDRLYRAGQGHTQINLLIDYLSGLVSGSQLGTVTVTIRDTDAIAATSGSGSVQETITRT